MREVVETGTAVVVCVPVTGLTGEEPAGDDAVAMADVVTVVSTDVAGVDVPYAGGRPGAVSPGVVGIGAVSVCELVASVVKPKLV